MHELKSGRSRTSARQWCRFEFGEQSWPAAIFCLRANRFPKVIPTRSATGSPTRSSICSTAKARRPGWTPVRSASPARRWRPPTAWSSPAKCAAPTITHEQIERSRAQGDQGHRLRAGRLPLGDGARSKCCCTPSPPTSPRASSRRQQGRRRRRPGHHVRLCLRETPELMPAPIYYAHKILEIARRGAQGRARRRDQLGPTPRARSRSNISNGKPVGVTQIVLSHPARR